MLGIFKKIHMKTVELQSDYKLLSGFPFIDHRNIDNNLESLCIS
jgi:hypothetical protein